MGEGRKVGGEGREAGRKVGRRGGRWEGGEGGGKEGREVGRRGGRWEGGEGGGKCSPSLHVCPSQQRTVLGTTDGLGVKMGVVK